MFTRREMCAGLSALAAEPVLGPNALEVTQVVHRGRSCLQLVDQLGLVPGHRLHRLAVGGFTNGVVEGWLCGAPTPGASPGARGFVGVAFRSVAEPLAYECIYVRVANARADDPVRRSRVIQYVSEPTYPWERLRSETPGIYEAGADAEVDVWTRFRLTVQGSTAMWFLGDPGEPALVVRDLKRGAGASGGVDLWIGPETIGRFADVRITRT